ncbi:MAG TPA: zf-HC2 domain-containing protein [Polyangiaceae bacterium]|nr:zf-HC2 domain-containing protein [Polyangiaceae bacterium]
MSARGAATLACQELVELVSDLVDGYLSLENRALIEEHLLVCPPCAVHIEQMRTTIDVIGRLRGRQEAPEIPAPLRDAFRRRQGA